MITGLVVNNKVIKRLKYPSLVVTVTAVISSTILLAISSQTASSAPSQSRTSAPRLSNLSGGALAIPTRKPLRGPQLTALPRRRSARMHPRTST